VFDGQGSPQADFHIGGNLKTSSHITASGNISASITASAAYLNIVGNAGFNEYLYHNGATDTFIQFEKDGSKDNINIEAGGLNMLYIVEGSAGHDKVTINNALADIDFQVKGTNDTNLFRTDAANDRVGIGFSTFSGEKDLSSSLHIGGDLTVGSGSSIGHITASGNFSGSVTSTGSFGRLTAVGNIHGTSVVGTNLYGTIGTAAQNSITSATSLVTVPTDAKLVALVIEF
jgi:hypothetical protein